MVLRTAIQVYLWFFEREKSNKMNTNTIVSEVL